MAVGGVCVKQGPAAMVIKEAGPGSRYMGTHQDRDGDWLDGGRRHRLPIPPKVSTANFWSVTI